MKILQIIEQLAVARRKMGTRPSMGRRIKRARYITQDNDPVTGPVNPRTAANLWYVTNSTTSGFCLVPSTFDARGRA